MSIKGIRFLLGTDLANDRVGVAPRVVGCPAVEVETEALEGEFPGIFPACVVTRA